MSSGETGMHAGGCQCGAVRYSVMRDLPAAYCCHCSECKKQTASAFSMTMALDYSDLSVEGEPTSFETESFSGKRKVNYFCGQCGTRLWHSATNPPGGITLKVGTLDAADQIVPVAHLWTSKQNDGFSIDSWAEVYDTQPDDVQGWRTKLQHRKG